MLFVPLCLCAFVVQAEENITVAVASSFYKQAKIYAAQFEARHDVKVRLVSGATGRLFNQIKQGAPFDIFIAADKQRPAWLKKTNQVIAYGYVGLQVGKQFTQNLQQLTQAPIKKIVIANPDVAPFGLAAKAMLQSQGLWELLKPKLVYAQNAMQAAMMVEQGLTDAGFVPTADKTHALATVPYVAALLSDKANAQLFYQVLGSEASASPSKQSHSATKVAPPSGSEVSTSPIEQSYSATKVAPPSGSEALASPNYNKP